MTAQKLADHSIVVTGGGSGIGAACALLAAREGARVTICGRTASKLDISANPVQFDEMPYAVCGALELGSPAGNGTVV